MVEKKYQVKILKNVNQSKIEEMLNSGWILNSIIVLPYSSYHGIISAETIEKKFYFIKETINNSCFNENNKHDSIYRDL
jgi:hypothetical protein